MQEYYIYCYMDPRKPTNLSLDGFTFTHEPFYIGKGSGSRDTEHLTKKGSRNPIFKAKIQKIKSLGFTPIIERISYFSIEQDAYLKEEYYIGEIGSNYISGIKDGPLTNYCLNARPPSHKGKTYKDIYGDKAEEQLEKRRQRQIDVGGYFGGRTHSKESRDKIRDSTNKRWETNRGPMLGRNHTLETRSKMSDTAKNNIKKRSIFVIQNPNNICYIVLHYAQFCQIFNLSRSTLNTAKAKSWDCIKSGKTAGWKLLNSKPIIHDLHIPLQEKLKEKPYITLDELNDSKDEWVDILKRLLSL